MPNPAYRSGGDGDHRRWIAYNPEGSWIMESLFEFGATHWSQVEPGPGSEAPAKGKRKRNSKREL